MSYIVEMENIRKEFPGIVANDNVTFKVKKGSIHALLGENGAGKSTLMSILFGLYQPTSGRIIIRGKKEVISGPNKANDLKIGMVHQHFKLVDEFTVTENIILGVEDTKYGFLNKSDARERVLQLSKKFQLDVDPDAKVKNISVGMQQRVEILKMLYRNAEILIFDEPTAVLTPQEIEELLAIMKLMITEGKTIILITHKLKEIQAVADTCTILRRGKTIDTVDVEGMDTDSLAEMMVGRKVNLQVAKSEYKPGDVVLSVKNLVVNKDSKVPVINDVSFEVRRGEVLAVAGIEGNGQSELIYALTGLLPVNSGTISYKGNDITKKSIKSRIEMGIGHIPEDRHHLGLVLDFTLEDNLILHEYNKSRFSNFGIINRSAVNEHANELIQAFDVRSGQGAKTIVRSMSGGNQQKAIIAREINLSPDLLIIAQPTRGLDVGAIEYIYNRIIEEREKGKAILLISLELEEVLSLSDRILVMYNGTISGEVLQSEADEFKLGRLMVGNTKGSDNDGGYKNA